MSKPIYFSKIEFKGRYGRGSFVVLLDLCNKELAYQEYKLKRIINTTECLETETYGGETSVFQSRCRVRLIRNGKTQMKPQIIKEPYEEKEIVKSWGMKLRQEDIDQLLPYVNALDFEPYRGRKMSMNDPGFVGYRDELTMSFSGITNSYIPKLELPMDYFYVEEYEWPSERLYRFLVCRYLSKFKATKKTVAGEYGALSMLC